MSGGQNERQSLDGDVKVILPAVLYGCETWSLNLSEEHWAKGAETDVHSEGLRGCCCSPGVVWVMRSWR